MSPAKMPRISVRRAVLRLAPYRAPEGGRAGKLRLDFNENTVGCSPAVLRSLARMTGEQMAIYPEYEAADTYIEPGDTVLLAEPTFDMYRFFSELAGARVVALRYDEEMRYPVEGVLRELRRRPRVLFISNPNNPTGTLVGRDALRHILSAATRTLVLVDEAYFDFSGLTVLPWLRRYTNLTVARTFSKSAGLAALRLGCLFARKEILDPMRRAGTPYPVNSAALVAAEAAIRDTRFLRQYTREVLKSRALLETGLAQLGARLFPSAGNFVLVDFGPRAHQLVLALERKGILVRERPDFPRAGYVRVSAGTCADTRRLLAAIKESL